MRQGRLLTESSQGVLLAVRAQAGARQNELRGVHDETLRVAVTQAPQKGKANQAILRQLAAELGLQTSQLTVVAGRTQPRKQILVQGITLEELRRRIESR